MAQLGGSSSRSPTSWQSNKGSQAREATYKLTHVLVVKCHSLLLPYSSVHHMATDFPKSKREGN